jgi:plasmid stabilization system protein ParE
MKVILTDAAEVDLEAIGDWIERDSPDRALTFVRELRRACETLADTPHGFALVPRYEHTGVRRRVHGNYLVFYRILGDVIEVLHVLHGARDYGPILFPNE